MGRLAQPRIFSHIQLTAVDSSEYRCPQTLQPVSRGKALVIKSGFGKKANQVNGLRDPRGPSARSVQGRGQQRDGGV